MAQGKKRSKKFGSVKARSTTKPRLSGCAMKVVDTAVEALGITTCTTMTTVPATPTTQRELLCNALIEGSGTYNRVGRVVCGKSLDLTIRIGATATITKPHSIRICCFVDMQANGTQAAWSDLFGNLSAGGTQTNGVLARANLQNSDRFKILWDHVIYDPLRVTGSGTGSDGARFLLRKKIMLRNLETRYKATAGTYADITTGSIWVFIAEVGSVADNAYLVDMASRYTFTD